MSSTILMAIVLVVMWLVVLVPMFVRRGDEAEVRSADRFATAMRVLSRRAPGSGGVAGRRRPATTSRAYAEGASPVRTAARVRMLRRRRRTLGVLAATAVVGLPAALIVSPLLWLVQVPAGVLLAGYVGWLRTQVRRERDRRTRRATLFGEPAAAAEHTARRPAPRARPEVGATAAPAAADRSWRPVPVPAPTYVTAPVARRRTDTLVTLDDDDLSFTELDPADAWADDYADRPRAVNE